jgi:hypothetical protein
VLVLRHALRVGRLSGQILLKDVPAPGTETASACSDETGQGSSRSRSGLPADRRFGRSAPRNRQGVAWKRQRKARIKAAMNATRSQVPFSWWTLQGHPSDPLHVPRSPLLVPGWSLASPWMVLFFVFKTDGFDGSSPHARPLQLTVSYTATTSYGLTLPVQRLAEGTLSRHHSMPLSILLYRAVIILRRKGSSGLSGEALVPVRTLHTRYLMASQPHLSRIGPVSLVHAEFWSLREVAATGLKGSRL